jgi:hypothetical protein
LKELWLGCEIEGSFSRRFERPHEAGEEKEQEKQRRRHNPATMVFLVGLLIVAVASAILYVIVPIWGSYKYPTGHFSPLWRATCGFFSLFLEDS